MKYELIFRKANYFYKLAQEDSDIGSYFHYTDLIKSMANLFHVNNESIINWIKLNEDILKMFIGGWRNERDYIQKSKFIKDINKFQDIFLTQKKQHLKYIDIYKSYTLKPYGKIPELYLVIGETVVPEMVSSEVAHNMFMSEALNFMFNPEGSDVAGFIEKYKNNINKIRSYFQYSPKTVGSGADGVAFDIAPNLILKIFKNDYSYNKAKEAQYRLLRIPELAKTEAMIYDIGRIGMFNSIPIYYWIIEKMIPLNNIEVRVNYDNIFDYVLKYISAHRYIFYRLSELIGKQKYPDFSTINDKLTDEQKEIVRKKFNKIEEYNSKIFSIINNKIKEQAKHIYESLISEPYEYKSVTKINDNLPDLSEDWLLELIEELIYKYITGRKDLHSGNIGLSKYKDKYKFRFFDPSFASSTTKNIDQEAKTPKI